ncbi:MAG: hypothetical protein GY698_13075 [Actinomycetia bacterium]|nr:hypothetical protein [Actinomycetes bacterium]
MTRRCLIILIALAFVAAGCSGGGTEGIEPVGSGGGVEPMPFDEGLDEATPDITAIPDPASDVDPVIVEGLAQAVVADQSGQARGVAITIEQARCLSARLVLALGVERLGELRLTESSLAEGEFGLATALFTPDERVALVDAALACIAVETLIGSADGLSDREVGCLGDHLEGSGVLRELALERMAGPAGEGPLDGDSRDEYLEAIRSCVDVAGIMFAEIDIASTSVSCVGAAIRTDPLLDEVFASLVAGEPVSADSAVDLGLIVADCLSEDELAALPVGP